MKIKIIYSHNFTKQLSKLNLKTQEDVYLAVDKFSDSENHKALKVHKLKGRFDKMYSFSVNHSYRIIFEYVDSKTVAFFLTVGDHDIYNEFLK